MPNPPKPTELKRKLGNPGGRPLPASRDVLALEPMTTIPSPPRPLEADGQAVWEGVWKGGRIWISPQTDIELVTLLCESYDERASLRVRVRADGDWRDRVALRSLDGQIVSMLSSLGFSPTDRTRLGFAEVKAHSKLDELIARRAQRTSE
jgi:phage terminase small subunit